MVVHFGLNLILEVPLAQDQHRTTSIGLQGSLTEYFLNTSMFPLRVKLDGIRMRVRPKVRIAAWRSLELLEVGNDDVLTEHVEIQVVL